MLIAHLPPGSATWAAIHGIPAGIGLTDLVLMDIYMAITGEDHPARPRTSTSSRSRTAELRERLRAQLRAHAQESTE